MLSKGDDFMAQAEISLSETLIGDKLYHLVINDKYYIKINKKQFEILKKELKMKEEGK